MKNINIVLNGKIVEGIEGETILQLAQRNKIDIPTLCHDPRLRPYSSCFVCVVEIEGMKGLQPSCSTLIREGMKVVTHNARINKSRKNALELMLSNHYADCIGPCKQACPAGVDVQGYISHIEKGQYHEAVALIKETNPFPAVCGRVCVRPCEAACRRNLLDEDGPVGIDYLKRFAADYDLMSDHKYKPKIHPPTGKKIAIIGGGPAGMSCAFFLQKNGHQADVYEAAPYAGGWLRYGIPPYRLPNDILQKEIDNITELGAGLYTGMQLGNNLSFNDLKEKYDAFVLAIGSQKGSLLGCEGEEAHHVLSGIDFLKEMEITGKKYDFTGKKIIIVGGGNTAMDCCRTAIRCGSSHVRVIYRRTEKEMPANPIEIHESKLEGVIYNFLTNPVRVNQDAHGNLKSLTLIKMELGEPDNSGRRRPIPIEGSAFEMEADFVLAAIGQKTDIDFIDDINSTFQEGTLKATRWGDVEANPETLETGIPGVFACGDGVTGPATLIQAIGQARIAAHSCHQFLSGDDITPMPYEFFSKKDNFKKQEPKDYENRFAEQKREEMPTLDPSERKNFCEVELGYASEEVAKHEANRCLECGCTALYHCDLKKYATEYHAQQIYDGGEYHRFNVDFRHPYIEFDNNKCILCARCVRICNEVVGANALGLVERGFNTYVAPSMGNALQDTHCESCGLCISACPTGAITENTPFKPGPVKTTPVKTICNYCSVGCELTLHHNGGFVMGTSGGKGKINPDGNICRYPKFGYHYLNDTSRITEPMMRIDGKLKSVSYQKAFKAIVNAIHNVNPDENAFFAGARLTNEEIYSVQKLARAAAKTNNIHSFHYLGRSKAFRNIALKNVPFDQIKGASKFYLIGAEINRDNAVAGWMMINDAIIHEKDISLVTLYSDSKMAHKANQMLRVNNYYAFVKSVIHYLLSNGLENAFFLKNVQGFEAYKTALLNENYTLLCRNAGVSEQAVSDFAEDYNHQVNAVLFFSEKEVCGNTAREIINLALITGKLGKTSNGIIALKEKNNAHGLEDMGGFPYLAPGGRDISLALDDMKKVWKTDHLSKVAESVFQQLEAGKIKNLFIVGEDPCGCTTDPARISKYFSAANCTVVMDYFLTETARHADILLPASFPTESGGTFTNSQRTIQEFDAVFPKKIGKTTLKALADLMKMMKVITPATPEAIREEAFKLFKPIEEKPFALHITEPKEEARIFDYGCDYLVKRFDDESRKVF
ncbi:MAG: FAD-dependent oxidoreductase [Bacteroidales bacterium]|nr:FAD-dependent oxidoreductase [Bacteroidales bacterium]